MLLLMAPVMKSFTPGTCLPFQTSRNICFDALKKQSASCGGLPGVTSHLSAVSADRPLLVVVEREVERPAAS